MADFAKIINATDGAQVLFYKSCDTEGRPTLVQASDHDGITISFEVGFGGDDFDRRDAAFLAVDVAQADSVRRVLMEFIEGAPQ